VGKKKKKTYFCESFGFDLECDDSTIEIFDWLGFALLLQSKARCRLVDQVNGFVGKETVRDVAMRVDDARNQCRVCDSYAVMDLVLFLYYHARNQDSNEIVHNKQKRVIRPRKIAIASSIDGSATKTGWKRRARAASFSICYEGGGTVIKIKIK